MAFHPETDTSDGNLTRSFVPRPIALCPTTLEVRGPLFSTVPDIQDLNLWSEKSIEKRYNIEKSHLKNVTEVLKTPLKNVLNI